MGLEMRGSGWAWRAVLAVLLLATGRLYAAEDSTLRAFDLPGSVGRMHYYASQPQSAPRSVLVVVHGYPRDANRSFEAGVQAARGAGRLGDMLVVAPIYQVPDERAARCQSPGVPSAQAGDALWTCGGWLAGEPSLGPHPIGAFAALDALVAELVRQWPSLREVTLAVFSAGAQMLQHSIGFAADPPTGVALRYVIADPGSWLYFDPVRPVPPVDCPGYDDWKYGVRALPAHLGRSAQQARDRYSAARVDYLEGERDSSAARGAFYPILDKSCAAMAQGPFRLQRGLAFAEYERAVLKPLHPRRMVVVPGCGHDVRCVLPAAASRPVLFGH